MKRSELHQQFQRHTQNPRLAPRKSRRNESASPAAPCASGKQRAFAKSFLHRRGARRGGEAKAAKSPPAFQVNAGRAAENGREQGR
eukprot:6958628-Pyramimonas_sp.AAC.1